LGNYYLYRAKKSPRAEAPEVCVEPQKTNREKEGRELPSPLGV